MALTALDAMREGYELYPVVDAIGGTSEQLSHRAGLNRVIEACGQPIGWVSYACELQRDLAREPTSDVIANIVLNERLIPEL
jgi:hypothetical protein